MHEALKRSNACRSWTAERVVAKIAADEELKEAVKRRAVESFERPVESDEEIVAEKTGEEQPLHRLESVAQMTFDKDSAGRYHRRE